VTDKRRRKNYEHSQQIVEMLWLDYYERRCSNAHHDKEIEKHSHSYLILVARSYEMHCACYAEQPHKRKGDYLLVGNALIIKCVAKFY
jgi:hypothetical protein